MSHLDILSRIVNHDYSEYDFLDSLRAKPINEFVQLRAFERVIIFDKSFFTLGMKLRIVTHSQKKMLKYFSSFLKKEFNFSNELKGWKIKFQTTNDATEFFL